MILNKHGAFWLVLAITFSSNNDLKAQEEAISPPREGGLIPFQPQKPIDRRLRFQPMEEAPVIRELKNSDQIRIIRSQADWYEVDIETQEGLIFRGWVKGDLPAALTAPDQKPESLEREPTLEPLRSDRFQWIWFGGLEESFSLRLGAGYQNLKFDSAGLRDINGDLRKISAPSYQLDGFQLHGSFDLSLMQTSLFKRRARWMIETDYDYGVYNVSFGSGQLNAETGIPDELEGQAYGVRTQLLKAMTGIDYRFLNKENYEASALFDIGFLFFESAPDLRRTELGNVVFTQVLMSGLPVRLGAKLGFQDNYQFMLRGGTVFLDSYSEESGAANEPDFKGQSFPILFEFDFLYRQSEFIGFFLQGEYLQTSIKKSGDSIRINETYQDLEADLSLLKLIAGIQFSL